MTNKMVVIVSVFIFILIVVLAGISSDWGMTLLDAIFWLDSRFLQAIQTMWNHHGFSGEKSNLSFPVEAE